MSTQEICINFLTDIKYNDLKFDIEKFYETQILNHSFTHPSGLTLTAVELPGSLKKPALVIIPGRGEIAHKYAEFLYSLKDSNIRVVILFARAQGGSTRLLADEERCHIDDFANFRQDIDFLIKKLKIEKYNLMAFSLGCLISLDLILNSNVKPQKAALLAPYIYPFYPLPKFILGALIRILGALPISNIAYTPHGGKYKRIAFEENNHSHSKIRYNAYHDYYADHKNLTIGGPTWGFLRQTYIAQQKLLKGNFEFPIPIRVLCAGDDKVVDTKVAFEFFKKHSKDKYAPKVSIIKNAYHDLLIEADEYRLQSLNYAIKFLFEDNMLD